MKPERIVIAGVLCLILFATPAVAASPHSSQSQQNQSVPLTLGLAGLITNAGDQQYELGGGYLVSGQVNGQPVSPGPIRLELDARVHQLSVSGEGTLQLSRGFNARITIDGAIPAAIFPLSPTLANCDPTSETCNSEIPLIFTGSASVNTGRGDSVHVPIGIESAYWDPLGRPIVISSLGTGGFTFSFVVTYNVATITWTGVQLQGGFEGTLGNEPVAGAYNQVTFSHENLLKGTEQDFGTIAFAYATDPSLDGHGLFFGHTSFTAKGGMDCSMPPFNFPLPEGTCLATGATSDGSFFMSGGQGAFILGVYVTIWSVPSLFTQTSVLASMF
jgi:hypothetical protein